MTLCMKHSKKQLIKRYSISMTSAIEHEKRQNFIMFVFTVLAVLCSDQTVKYLSTKHMFFNATTHKNYETILGVFTTTGLFPILTIVLLFILYLNKSFSRNKFAAISSGLFLAGILSNAIDVLRYNYIIDYINLLDLFSFNLADLAIYSGAIILGWKTLNE